MPTRSQTTQGKNLQNLNSFNSFRLESQTLFLEKMMPAAVHIQKDSRLKRQEWIEPALNL